MSVSEGPTLSQSSHLGLQDADSSQPLHVVTQPAAAPRLLRLRGTLSLNEARVSRVHLVTPVLAAPWCVCRAGAGWPL